MCAKKFTKPLPYRVKGNSYPINTAAKSLREQLRPLMQRRLPTVYFSGFGHGYSIQCIKKYKQTHPYFLKFDIQKYYPSVLHQTVLVNAQLDYRDLLGTRSVPKKFKQDYLPSIHAFLQNQPAHYGIPLGNSMSSVLAVLVFVPLLLQLKKQGIPFIVFADDFLVFGTSQKEMNQLYVALQEELSSIGLIVNPAKTTSGCIASVPFTYCGWAIQGGFYGVAKDKVSAFKEKIDKMCVCKKPKTIRQKIKTINQTIVGFGHYYKYGNVVRLFCQLDSYVRKNLRIWLKTNNLPYLNNLQLKTMGLKSLWDIIQKITLKLPPTKKLLQTIGEAKPKQYKELPLLNELIELQTTMVNQNKEIVAQLKKLNSALHMDY